MQKKAQAAMEFLMTYGWAIIVVLIVVATLFSLGVFNPKVPNNCVSVSPISCTDVKLNDAGDLELSLSSSDTDSALLNEVKLTIPVALTCTSVQNGNPPPNGIPLDFRQKLVCPFGANPSLIEGNRFDGTAKITYMLSGGTSSHTLNLKFSGTIEE